MKVNFNNIYEKIYKASKEELSNIKKKNTKDILMLLMIIGILLLILFFVNKVLMAMALFSSFIVFIIFVSKKENKFREIYKFEVIRTLVEEYSKDLKFSPLSSLTRREYANSRFDINFDRFRTEDEINGKLSQGDTIKMAQVTTYKEEYVDDGNGGTEKREVMTFNGLYGYVILNTPIFNNITITTNYNAKRYDKNRIEVESSEFEKLYDLYAIDKVHAMEIFTSELIEKFVKLNENKKYIFNMKIENSTIYFRYRCGEIFEPPRLSEGVDFKLLYKYFSTINFPIEIIEEIIEKSKAVGI